MIGRINEKYIHCNCFFCLGQILGIGVRLVLHLLFPQYNQYVPPMATVVKLLKQLSNFNTKSNKLPALADDDDNLVTGDLEKADLLNKFFTSQSTIDDSNGILPIYIDETVK